DEVEALAVEQHVLLLDAEGVRLALAERVVEDAAAWREALAGDRRRVDLLHSRSIYPSSARFSGARAPRPDCRLTARSMGDVELHTRQRIRRSLSGTSIAARGGPGAGRRLAGGARRYRRRHRGGDHRDARRCAGYFSLGVGHEAADGPRRPDRGRGRRARARRAGRTAWLDS